MSWKRFFDYCNAKTFFMQVQCFLTPSWFNFETPKLVKKGALISSSNNQEGFSFPSPRTTAWLNNSVVALLQDIWAAADKCDCTFFSQICMAVQWVWLSQLIFALFLTGVFFFLSWISPWSSSSSDYTNNSGVM